MGIHDPNMNNSLINLSTKTLLKKFGTGDHIPLISLLLYLIVDIWQREVKLELHYILLYLQ